MIRPWLLATAVFLVFNYIRFRASGIPPEQILPDLAYSLARPFWHLWYAPALVLMVLALKGLLRRFSPETVLVAALVFGIACGVARFYFYHPFRLEYPAAFKVYAAFRKYHPDFFYFLVPGFCMRNCGLRAPGSVVALLLLAGTCLRIYLHGLLPGILAGHSFWGFFRFPDFFVLNTGLALLVLRLLDLETGRITKWLGENSMGLYLYHPLFLFTGRRLATVSGLSPYFFTLPLLFLCFGPFFFLGTKIPAFNRIFFGYPDKPSAMSSS